MSASLSTLTPDTAWQPLPASEWDEAAARHLLQRLGFGAPSPAVARALQEPPAAFVRRCFARMPDFGPPESVISFHQDADDARELRRLSPAARRAAQQERRERSREALTDLTLRWLRLAAAPEHAAAEKWLLFLSDVWVVSIEKVRDADLIFQHQDILRRRALGSAPALARAVLRSPAMIRYLDLQQSRAGAPNENFARELFELFTLGEGHYSETDIKEAARAFTGYRERDGQFHFAARQHDREPKTIFGQTGRFDGDDVIDLVFRQPAAGRFLPAELSRFYLTTDPLPEALLTPLGAAWASGGYDLRALAARFFTSRLFFAPDFRGNFIKSPVQFYLGLVQDLSLDVAPLSRRLIGPLRQMGQLPFDPPNVRGWVGGRSWINSATLAARRQLIRSLVTPLDLDTLNADERAALRPDDADGSRAFTFPVERLAEWSRLAPADAAARLVSVGFRGADASALTALVGEFLAAAPRLTPGVLREALASLLQLPAYQLC